MNNLFIKTAEACSPGYVDENGVSQSGIDPRNPNSDPCAGYNQAVEARLRKEFLDSTILHPVTITFGVMIITAILFFFLIAKRKNIQSTTIKMVNLIGILVCGAISMGMFLYGMILLEIIK